MWITAEDARSDFVLAAAAALLGPILQGFVSGLPFYPRGLIGTMLGIAWLFAMTGLVPVLLAGYRDHGLSAFGLDQPQEGLGTGVIVALPLVVAGWLAFWLNGVSVIDALLGLLPFLSGGQGLVVDLLAFAVVTIGSVLLYTFLTVRARHAFKATHLTQVEALRTFGMGAVAVAAVLGLLLSISGNATSLLLRVAGVAGLVLVADRYVQPADSTTRSTVLAPAITVLVFWVFRSGGLFRGSLLDGLYAGSLAAAIAVTVAILVETRRHAWATVPVLAAAALYGVPLLV
ncbi:MAG TPA: hypothetical protein VGA69_04220 [Nitriliruptorales bacterium]